MPKWNLDVPEASRDMMIFQHRPVVIQKRRIAAGHYMEIVCGPSVFVIVNNRCHEGGENLEIGQPILQGIMNNLSLRLLRVQCEPDKTSPRNKAERMKSSRKDLSVFR